VIGELRVAAEPSAKFGPGAWVDLLVYRVIWFAFDDLAVGEAESLGSGSPPSAGWFSGLSGIDVVGGQLKIADRDQREGGAGRLGKGQLPGGTTNSKSAAEVTVLTADAEWRGKAHHCSASSQRAR
jgi:hypothetical protein